VTLEGLRPLLLIVMYEKQTWRLRPGETFTFGRALASTAVLPAGDRGLSRRAGSFRFDAGSWWVHNDSSSSLLFLSGDLGFRVDLPPGMRAPLQQWHVKVLLHGFLDDYTLRLRLPDLDEVADEDEADGAAGASVGAAVAAAVDPVGSADDSGAVGKAGGAEEGSGAGDAAGAGSSAGASGTTGAVGTDGGAGTAEQAARPQRRRPRAESIVTSTHHRLSLTDGDRLVLAARFEEYLSWRHVGAPAPLSAARTAERIGWQPHAVSKRCENIRNRFTGMGVPGLRGPRALEELVRLLMSTGTLTADDLRLLPPKRSPD
jgi:hypothetical protein